MSTAHPQPKTPKAAWLLYPLTVLTMLPVTGVVPILKNLIYDQYAVGELATSAFMSINMIGAIIGAPILGRWADGKNNHLNLLIFCALVDASLWITFSTLPPFYILLSVRLLEGAAHIGALTMIMALMGHLSEERGRRAHMAALGGCIMFGVAMGSPLGGILGKLDVVLPLQAGAGVMALVAATALVLKLDDGLRQTLDSMGSRTDKTARGSVWSLRPLQVSPPFRLPYLFGFVDRFTIGVFIIAFMLYTAHLGHGPQTTGFLIGAFMIPFAFLSYPIGKLAEPLGLWRFVLVGSLLFGLAYGAVPWLSGWHLWAAMGVCGVLSAVMFGPNLMLVTKASTPQNRASAVAGFNTAGSLGFLVGPMTGGALLQGIKGFYPPEVTFRIVFALVGATEVVCVAWGLWRLKTEPQPSQRDG